jgi:hypothetical protein
MAQNLNLLIIYPIANYQPDIEDVDLEVLQEAITEAIDDYLDGLALELGTEDSPND